MHIVMDLKKIKTKIHKLASEISAEKCQEGVRKLDQEIQTFDLRSPIQKFPSGDYWYFRSVEYDYTTSGPYKKRNIPGERLGRISKENYLKKKKIIDKLMSNRNKEEIKKYLEQY